MRRNEFHRLFNSPGPIVLPVIHVLDTNNTVRNIEIAMGEGASGVFLINHDFEKERLIPIIHRLRDTLPALWLGVNFLAVTGKDAFPILGELEQSGCRVDAYWADDARIDELRPHNDQREAQEIADVRSQSGWSGLYFGGTAFKKQRPVDPDAYEASAQIAACFMDVVTTSGAATGLQADLTKIESFRAGAGDTPLALASGINPENAGSYIDVDAFMVATGINLEGDFYNIDPARLARLIKKTRSFGGGNT